MPEIVLTVNTTTSEPLAEMKPLLDEFEQLYNVHVSVRLLTWAESWWELVKIALYRRGADTSQVGSTWMGGLASMNVLRPFSPSEIAVVGSASDFVPTIWQSGVTADGSQVLSLPWITDNFFILYWRDMLAEAGVTKPQPLPRRSSLSTPWLACRQLGSIPGRVLPRMAWLICTT